MAGKLGLLRISHAAVDLIRVVDQGPDPEAGDGHTAGAVGAVAVEHAAQSKHRLYRGPRGGLVQDPNLGDLDQRAIPSLILVHALEADPNRSLSGLAAGPDLRLPKRMEGKKNQSPGLEASLAPGLIPGLLPKNSWKGIAPNLQPHKLRPGHSLAPNHGQSLALDHGPCPEIKTRALIFSNIAHYY